MREELPAGWSELSVREVCSLINGRAFKPTEWSDRGLPIVRIQNLNDLSKPFNLFDAEVDPRFYIEDGELLFAWSGTPGTSFGAHIWHRGRAILNQHIFRVLPRLDIVEKPFLRYAINDRLDHLIGIAHGGAGLAHVTKPVFEATPLRIPPLNEQRRIVAKLEDLLARSRRAKDALDAIPPLLEKLRQSILAAAFRGDLTADWRAKNPDGEPAEELLKRIRIERRKKWEEAELAKLRAKGKAPADDRWKAKYKEPEPVNASELPELPEGWCWASLDLCSREMTVGHVGPMQTEYVTDGIPFLRSQNVRRSGYDPSALCFIGEDFHGRLSKSALSPGDVVIVRTGDPGVACVIPKSVPVANCSDLVIVRMTGSILPTLACMYLNSDFARAHVSSEQVGVAQQHFNVGAARNMPIPVPPPAEQQRIVEALERAEAAVERSTSTHRLAAAALERLGAASLAKAFRGELVEQDPKDEPASVMLERLAAERQAAQEAPAAPKRSSRQKARG